MAFKLVVIIYAEDQRINLPGTNSFFIKVTKESTPAGRGAAISKPRTGNVSDENGDFEEERFLTFS